MDYQTKTKTQTRVDINFEVAGPLVPVVSQPTPPQEEPVVELTSSEIIQLAEYALEDTQDIAEEVESFRRKKFAVFQGLKGQVKVAAASLAAYAVVVCGLAAAPRVAHFAQEHEAYSEMVEEYKNSEEKSEEACMLRSDFSEGFECLD